MLLSSLIEFHHATANGLTPIGYRQTPVHWWLDLGDEEDVLHISRTSASHGPQGRKVGIPWAIPYVKATNNVRPRLLADRAAHVFGIHSASMGNRGHARAILGHASFVDLVGRCAEAVNHPGLHRVAAFLRHYSADVRARLPHTLEPEDICVFRVDGEPLVNVGEIQQWWEEHQDQGPRGICLHCQQERTIARVHPFVQGIPGGVATGTVLVSSNCASFESYGLSQGHVAALCNRCSQAYTESLNRLLASTSTRLIFHESKVAAIVWREDGQETELLSIMASGEPEAIRALLSQQPREPESNAVLHVAALSATGGRIIVRDHFSTTVGAATRNVTRFLQNQALPSANGEPEWFTLQELERSLVHPNRIPGRQMEGRSRVPVPVAPALLRLAFLGEPSKPWLLHLASRRARILSSAPIVSHRQRGALASLIKLTQSSNGRDADGRGLAGLGQLENAVETGSAFLAGRLLALAQALWRIHGPRNGVMGHWFSVAATAPRMALPRLAEQVRQQLSEPATLLYPHMSAYLQKEFDELLRGVDRFPIRLSVAEQGVFALGHYYQHIQAEQAIAQAFGHRQVA